MLYRKSADLPDPPTIKSIRHYVHMPHRASAVLLINQDAWA